ncbi:MAG: hypothetical protein AAGA93_19035 [Actinomycetota bacterium]
MLHRNGRGLQGPEDPETFVDEAAAGVTTSPSSMDDVVSNEKSGSDG